MRRSELLVALDRGREVTTPAGALTVLLVGCETCGAEAGWRCRSYTWPDSPPGNQVHAARRVAAVRLVERGPL